MAVKLGEADVLNTFEVLAGLEGMSGVLAAQRITDAELRRDPRAALRDARVLRAHATCRATTGSTRMIHTAINPAARNPVLGKAYRDVNARVQSLRFRTNQNEAKWKLAVKEHDRR